MKTILLFAILICNTFISALAQHDHSNQKTTTNSNTNIPATSAVTDENSKKQLSQILSSYYNIKNALVSEDAISAASNASQFLNMVNTVDFKVISEGNIHILSKDAGKISGTKELKKQREYFADLSTNMAAVAKALKPGNEPIYMQYCPMKKASWLSSEKQIRNPYYGSSMLTCGEVTETL